MKFIINSHPDQAMSVPVVNKDTGEQSSVYVNSRAKIGEPFDVAPGFNHPNIRVVDLDPPKPAVSAPAQPARQAASAKNTPDTAKE